MIRLINGCEGCPHYKGVVCDISKRVLIDFNDKAAQVGLSVAEKVLRVRFDNGAPAFCPLSLVEDMRVIATRDQGAFTEELNIDDPKHHVWRIASKKTGRAAELHFYPGDGFGRGHINADLLEDAG